MAVTRNEFIYQNQIYKFSMGKKIKHMNKYYIIYIRKFSGNSDQNGENLGKQS